MSWYEDLMDRKRKEGKTKIIPDRENKKTYLERLHLHKCEFQLKLFGKKFQLKLPFRVNLHCIHISDDPTDGLHDHPWPFITIILKGGYYEHLKNGKRKWRRPGTVIFSRAKRLHRLELTTEKKLMKYPDCDDCHYMGDAQIPCWTLFIMGPRRRKATWGFLVNGKWYEHDRWLALRERFDMRSWTSVVNEDEKTKQVNSFARLWERFNTEAEVKRLLKPENREELNAKIRKVIDERRQRDEEHEELLRSLQVNAVQNRMVFTADPEFMEKHGIDHYEVQRFNSVNAQWIPPEPPTKNQKVLNVYNKSMKGL